MNIIYIAESLDIARILGIIYFCFKWNNPDNIFFLEEDETISNKVGFLNKLKDADQYLYIGSRIEPEWIEEMMNGLGIKKFDPTEGSGKTNCDVTEEGER